MQYRKFLLTAAAAVGFAAGGFLLGRYKHEIGAALKPAEEVQDSLTYGEVSRYVPPGYMLKNLKFYDINADGKEDAIFTYSYYDDYEGGEINTGNSRLGILISYPSKPNRYKIKRYIFHNYTEVDEERYVELSVSHDNKLEMWVTFFTRGNNPDYMTYIFRINNTDIQQVGKIQNMIRSLYNGSILAENRNEFVTLNKQDPRDEVVEIYTWQNNRYIFSGQRLVRAHVVSARDAIISLIINRSGLLLERGVNEILGSIPQFYYRHFALLTIPETIDSLYGGPLSREDIERQLEFQDIAAKRLALRTMSPMYRTNRFLLRVGRDLEVRRLMEEEQRLRER